MSVAKDIWQWCERRNIFLFASYISSAKNVEADKESRRNDTDTEWSLCPRAFELIRRRYGPFDIDLFATVLSAKCSVYLSWFPDPYAWAVDAFTVSWNNFFFYAFPPFILVTRVLRKIIDEEAEGILVVPELYQNRLLVSDPIIFPPSNDLLSAPFRDHHPAYKTLSLAAGHLSGKR